MAKNRTCFLCGNKYDYCPTCPSDRLKPKWHSMFCKDICKKVDEILSAHTAKRLTDEKAKEALSKLDLSGLNIKDEDIKRHLDSILSAKVSKPTPDTTKVSQDIKQS